MRTLFLTGSLVAALGLAVPALAAGPAPAGGMKMTSGACGKAPRWDQCKLRSFDAKPDTKTPVPFELGSGKKDG
ncbi:hypothetical protein WDZ92_29430 [Nostoc sp. NIES-2111]